MAEVGRVHALERPALEEIVQLDAAAGPAAEPGYRPGQTRMVVRILVHLRSCEELSVAVASPSFRGWYGDAYGQDSMEQMYTAQRECAGSQNPKKAIRLLSARNIEAL